MPAAVVLNDLDLVVHDGEAVALLGRNGVGKTTTLARDHRHSTQKRRPHHVRRHGHHQGAHYEINRAGISLVPEGRRLFPNLTVLENLRIAARPGGASLEDIFDAVSRSCGSCNARVPRACRAASARCWRSPAR